MDKNENKTKIYNSVGPYTLYSPFSCRNDQGRELHMTAHKYVRHTWCAAIWHTCLPR